MFTQGLIGKQWIYIDDDAHVQTMEYLIDAIQANAPPVSYQVFPTKSRGLFRIPESVILGSGRIL